VEHYNFSDILAVIVDMVIANKVVQKIINKEEENIDKANKKRNFNLFKYSITTTENHFTRTSRKAPNFRSKASQTL